MSSFKELNGPLETEFHSFFKLGGGSNNHPSSSSDLSPPPNDLTSCQAHSNSGENYIAFDQSIQKHLSFGSCGEKDHSNAVQHLRATMPDQDRCILKTSVSNLSQPISIVSKSFNQHPHQQNLESSHIPISDIILQHQQSSLQSHSSPRLHRRYSKPQGESCDCDFDLDLVLDTQQESSVDGDQEDLLKKFQNSVQDSRHARRRSSPDILEVKPNFRPARTTGLRFPTSVNSNNYNNVIESAPISAITTTTVPTVDYPIRPSQFPGQSLILSKMVDNKVNTQRNQPQVDNAVVSSSSSSPTSLIPSKSCPKFHTLDDDLVIDIYSVQNCSKQSSALLPSQPNSAVISSNDFNTYGTTNSDAVDSSASSSGFGFLSKTRQFGTWLGLSADSKDKVEISKKDLNVFAPTTF